MKRNNAVKRKHYFLLFAALVAVLIILDQWLKIWIKTNMALHEAIPVFGEWFQLQFVENPGMAFGFSFGGGIGKMILSLFRLIISGFLIYYVFILIKKEKIDALMLSIFSLIIAGALGNIIDSCFYGLVFDSGTTFNAEAGRYDYYSGVSRFSSSGYAPFLHGCVVDMFCFKLFYIPKWVPFWGGYHFFPAIFNIADSCVTVGLAGILIFNKRIFTEKKQEELQDEHS